MSNQNEGEADLRKTGHRVLDCGGGGGGGGGGGKVRGVYWVWVSGGDRHPAAYSNR